MICVSIIYRVRIISIANISGRFMVSDTLSLLNAYQKVNDNSGMSDRYVYLYCHLHKAPQLRVFTILYLIILYVLKLLKNYQPTLFIKFIIAIVVVMHVT